ncbi:MAG: methyltransferase type [Geobacteraceae bacterium]|nr:MAG: methyltransferase type [Geobacteraceae bacterium]
MATVEEHYESLLADYYSWMFGDFDAKVEANRRFFSYYDIVPAKSGIAVDLGAGPGFQSLALAQLGFRVTAFDLSGKLLSELEGKRGDLPVTAVHDDMLNFPAHRTGPVELCVCMGDTLPHLESTDRVADLFGKVYHSLDAGGRFILTYRDLSFELTGLSRFIPVRSDDTTIFTCFLEYEPRHVTVHDLVYVRMGEKWELRKSSYRKLRLQLDWVLERLVEAGFAIDSCESNGGMVTIIADKGESVY